MKTKVSDINKISIIKVDDWKSAYIDIIENDYLNRMSLNEQIDKYNNSYSLKDVFVAELNNEIVGFCRVYDYNNPEFEDTEIDCEIKEIYVRPDMKRMVIGSKLFNFVLNYFKTKEYDFWENNSNGLDIDKCEGLKYSSDNYLLRVNYYK